MIGELELLNELFRSFIGYAGPPSGHSSSTFKKGLVLAVVNKQWMNGQGQNSEKSIVERPQSWVLPTLASLGLKVPYGCINGDSKRPLRSLEMLNGELGKSDAFAFSDFFEDSTTCQQGNFSSRLCRTPEYPCQSMSNKCPEYFAFCLGLLEGRSVNTGRLFFRFPIGTHPTSPRQPGCRGKVVCSLRDYLYRWTEAAWESAHSLVSRGSRGKDDAATTYEIDGLSDSTGTAR